MRMVVLAAGLALLMGSACGLDAEHLKKQHDADEFSASRLDGKFASNDLIVQMLSPEERAALGNAGMMADAEVGSGDPAAEDGGEKTDGDNSTDAFGQPKTTGDKIGDAMMSMLTVGITLGMMAAPYLLF
jgi:hypothetical protein